MNDSIKEIQKDFERFHNHGLALNEQVIILDENIVENSLRDFNKFFESRDEFFRKHRINEECKLLPEGIDIDEDNWTVAYNPNHEDYVSTSLQNNPTKNYGFGKGVNVWSVFKRNKIDRRDRDGNPLVYALKNINGWRFKTKQDRNNLLNQMALIIDKFTNENGVFSPTVVIPSGSALNMLLANMVKERNPKATIIDDILVKMSAEDVYYETISPNTPFRKFYNTDKLFKVACDKLWGFCCDMKEKHRGEFSYRFVTDDDMRNVIGRTLKVTNDREGKYSEDINGKDILIVDDTISRGSTINCSIDAITDTFIPKSITVLTMFSKL